MRTTIYNTLHYRDVMHPTIMTSPVPGYLGHEVDAPRAPRSASEGEVEFKTRERREPSMVSEPGELVGLPRGQSLQQALQDIGARQLARAIPNLMGQRQIQYRGAPRPYRLGDFVPAAAAGLGALGYQAYQYFYPEEERKVPPLPRTQPTKQVLHHFEDPRAPHIPRGVGRTRINPRYVGDFKFPLGAHNYVEYQKYAENNTLNSLLN